MITVRTTPLSDQPSRSSLGGSLRSFVLWPAVLAVVLLGGVLTEGKPSDVPQAQAADPHAGRRSTVDGETVRERPNVVVVMADDMRADDMRFMPRVRRLLMAHGLSYRNSFSPFPLCCPARASFLTGQYAHNHHVLGNEAPYGFASFDDRATLATALRDAGYRTGFVGKYLNNYGVVRSRVTGQPSATYVPAGWTDWRGLIQVRERGGPGTYHYFHPIFNIEHRVRDYDGRYQTTLLGRFARELVRRYAGGDRPFFLYLSALAPHTGAPVEPDDVDFVRRENGTLSYFPTAARPAWIRGRANALVTRSPGVPANGIPEGDVTDKPASVRLPPLSHAEIGAELRMTRQRAEALLVLDLEVARLLRTLRATGELDHTVVMFTSDNGYFLGEHRRRLSKKLPYEPSLRVPLVITGPGVPHGRRYDPVVTVDLTATILDLADARPPHPADGTSLLPNVRYGDRGWTTPVLTEAIADFAAPGGTRAARGRGFGDPRTTIGLRTARYKLIRWASGAVELYDLDRDPNELHNRAHDPHYAHLRTQLTRLWWRYKDCVATVCTRPLPAPLRTTPDSVAGQTVRQAEGVRAWWTGSAPSQTRPTEARGGHAVR